MTKKVNFYKVSLCSAIGEKEIEHTEIREHIAEIIRNNSVEQDDFWVLDLSDENELHKIIDVFEYTKEGLFLRASNQKPSGVYLQRDYKTKIPGAVLEGTSEREQGIEQYTYLYLNYTTGILAIVNQQGAPSYRIINELFYRYNYDYYLKFVAIPNSNGIQRIYESKEPKITQVEVEVPVPDAGTLQKMFGWNTNDVLSIPDGAIKATMKITGIDRQLITHGGDETKGLIDCIRSKIKDYSKARIRAKADGVKTQDYSFFDENFTYPVEIATYRTASREKYYYTAKELISIYRENLIMAYNENINTLRVIANR